MSKQFPEDSGRPKSAPTTIRRTGLRALPGFKTAAVAFVLTVLLSSGGVAIAKWNQSATATIDITAGAAAPTVTPTPTPTPSTTPAPSPTPSPTPTGPAPNIVAGPGIVARPASLNSTLVDCNNNGSSGKFDIIWPASSGASGYVVSVNASNGTRVVAPINVPGTLLAVTIADDGEYILRIQPMNNSIAGDSVYRTLKFYKQGVKGCSSASPADRSPLGTFAFSSAVAAAPNTNVLNLTWNKAASASRYLVSIKDPTTGYGAEFSSTAVPTAANPVPLIFPTAAHQSAPPYGNYTLRIIPMKDSTGGAEAGDPVYQTVSYQSTGLTWSVTRTTP